MIKKLLNKEKGAIILIFVVFLPFMLGFVGLAIDFAYIYSEKTKLQNAADAAALAGVVHLKDTDPPVHSYVLSMLDDNGFSATESPATDDLSEAANWKLTYEQEPKDGGVPIVTPNMNLATRLRVTLSKNIRLVFLPIITRDMATIDITATSVARGTINAEIKDEFQFITLKEFIIGNKVHVPSFPSGITVSQEDDDKVLDQNIYAHSFSFGSGSTMRVGAKVYTSNKVVNHLTSNLKMTDPENYIEVEENSKDLSDIKSRVRELRAEGKRALRDATDENSIKINVDEYPLLLSGIGDYQLKEILKKYPRVPTKIDFFDDLDILVPVIFYSETRSRFLIPVFNVSFYSFTAGIIVSGGSIQIAGSKPPNESGGLGTSTREKQQFGNIYCFYDKDNGSNLPDYDKLSAAEKDSGMFSTVTGNIYPKEFNGTVYADCGITIYPPNNYRRHTFNRMFATPAPIKFPADGTRDSANIFTSVQTSTKLSLVE